MKSSKIALFASMSAPVVLLAVLFGNFSANDFQFDVEESDVIEQLYERNEA